MKKRVGRKVKHFQENFRRSTVKDAQPDRVTGQQTDRFEQKTPETILTSLGTPLSN